MVLKKNHSTMIMGVAKNLFLHCFFPQDLSILAQAFASWRHGPSSKVAQFLRAEAMRQMQVGFNGNRLGWNIAPENVPSQKERIVFQPSFFKGELLNFGGVR